MARKEAAAVKQFNKLLFNVRASVRYHFRRQRFFDNVNTVMLTVAALAGFATTVGVISEMYAVARWTSVVTGAVSAMQLVFGPGRAARSHSDLAREFIQLERRVVSAGATELQNLRDERLRIESGEPPHYRTLNLICHNEVVRATGESEQEYVDIPWLLRVLAQFTDMGSGSLEKRTRQVVRS